MASRYWVGQPGVPWSDPSNWAETPNGTPGASPPGAEDDVYLNREGGYTGPNRFWVGANKAWDSAATANWSVISRPEVGESDG